MKLELTRDEKSYELEMISKEIKELRLVNDRLADSERNAVADQEALRHKNIGLMAEVEDVRRQARCQAEAIMQAGTLKEHANLMLADYDKCKADLNYHIQKNEELVREFEANLVCRQKAEHEAR